MTAAPAPHPSGAGRKEGECLEVQFNPERHGSGGI